MLVERDRELAELSGLLAQSGRGVGRAALVSGGPGTGKTALLDAFTERAVESGATVLTATGSRAEQAIPGGVLSQALQGAPLAAPVAERVRDLLAAHASSRPDRLDGPLAPDDARATQCLAAALLDLGSRGPLVVCIDDLHMADEMSLSTLLFLRRRMRTTGVLLVLAETALPRPPHPEFTAELVARSPLSRIRLDPLSPDGVGALLEAHRGPAAVGLAPAQHAVCGGNPALVHAVLTDLSRGDGGADHLVGRAFGEAVVACLHRCGPAPLDIGRGVALLGEEAHVSVLGDLTGLGAEAVTEHLAVISSAGVLDGGRFRHPVARDAVLDDIDPGERAERRLRAARLLYNAGVPPHRVARFVVEADLPVGSWAVPVLRAGAEEALRRDDLDLAARHLELALRAVGDDGERVGLLSALAQVWWRRDPGLAAVRCLAPLRTAHEEGGLTGADTVALVRQLLWQGDFAEAESIARGTGAVSTVNYQWLAHLYPSALRGSRHLGLREPQPAGSAGAAWLRTSVAFRASLAQGRREEVLSAAEYVLQSRTLEDDLEALLSALLALVWFDRPDRAERWCAVLSDRAEVCGSDTWIALLGAVRAQILLRRGDLPAAAAHASASLATLAGPSWGVAIAAPLAVLVAAATAMGNHDEAEGLLRKPPPPAALETVYGVHYLFARAGHHLAHGHLHAALADFHHCGELLAGWGMDLPAVLPWRAQAARAHQLLGRRDRARELIDEQMALPTGDAPRPRALALRAFATTLADPRGQVSALRESSDLLQDLGDRYELAGALVELSAALDSAADPDNARSVSRRALQLAKSCQAKALIRARKPPSACPPRPRSEADSIDLEKLSGAERRVAALAAQGHDNREIGRRLHITVSTVEQHLTRVYRKLNVRRRGELVAAMHAIRPS